LDPDGGGRLSLLREIKIGRRRGVGFGDFKKGNGRIFYLVKIWEWLEKKEEGGKIG